MFRNLFALALNTVMCIYKNVPCSEDLSPPDCRWGFRPQTLWLSLLINPPFQNPRSATVNCCKKTRIQSRQTELFPGYRTRCTVLQSSPRYCTFKYRHQYRRQFSFCLKSSTNIPRHFTHKLQASENETLHCLCGLIHSKLSPLAMLTCSWRFAMTSHFLQVSDFCFQCSALRSRLSSQHF